MRLEESKRACVHCITRITTPTIHPIHPIHPPHPPAHARDLCLKQQLVATNVNDILHRFFTTGEYHKAAVTQTSSPSMDISISSNFERCVSLRASLPFLIIGLMHKKNKNHLS